MNTMAHMAGLVSTVYMAYFVFGELGNQYLGWAFVVLSVWLVISMMFAIEEDWISRFGVNE